MLAPSATRDDALSRSHLLGNLQQHPRTICPVIRCSRTYGLRVLSTTSGERPEILDGLAIHLFRCQVLVATYAIFGLFAARARRRSRRPTTSGVRLRDVISIIAHVKSKSASDQCLSCASRVCQALVFCWRVNFASSSVIACVPPVKMGSKDSHPGADRVPRPAGVRDKPLRDQAQVHSRRRCLWLCAGACCCCCCCCYACCLWCCCYFVVVVVSVPVVVGKPIFPYSCLTSWLSSFLSRVHFCWCLQCVVVCHVWHTFLSRLKEMRPHSLFDPFVQETGFVPFLSPLRTDTQHDMTALPPLLWQ